MSALKRRWKLVPLAALAVLVAAFATSAAAARSNASTIKIAVLSDCQGAFGSFDNQDLAGVVTAMAQYAGAKAKNPNKPRDGWVGGTVAGHPLKLVGVGCSNDRADTAIKETKRLMERLGADIMIGPLSGDESIAVANYAKQHPTKTFVDGSAGAQDTTLKVRAPNFFRFNGDGAQWNAGLGAVAYKKLKWKTAAQNYANKVIGKWFKQIPPFGAAAPQAASTFTYGYYANTWGLMKGLQAVKGDISGGQKKLQKALGKTVLNGPYGTVKLDKN